MANEFGSGRWVSDEGWGRGHWILGDVRWSVRQCGVPASSVRGSITVIERLDYSCVTENRTVLRRFWKQTWLLFYSIQNCWVTRISSRSCQSVRTLFDANCHSTNFPLPEPYEHNLPFGQTAPPIQKMRLVLSSFSNR